MFNFALLLEVTDQNFVDEDLEAKPSQKRQGMKRVKTSLVSESSNDQVNALGYILFAALNSSIEPTNIGIMVSTNIVNL